VLRTTADVVDPGEVDTERGELGAHRRTQIDECLLPFAPHDDAAAPGRARDRFGHVGADLEAARSDARSDGGQDRRGPFEVTWTPIPAVIVVVPFAPGAPEANGAGTDDTGDDAAPARVNGGHGPRRLVRQ
jgi:hypothetical protein